MVVKQGSVADEFAIAAYLSGGQGGWHYVAAGGEITVNSTYARSQAHADVARLADGNFIVTWIDADFNTSAGRYIRAQLYAPDGSPVGGELTLASLNGGIQPAVAGLAGGGFVLIWQTGGIRMQLFDGDGVALAPATTIISSTIDHSSIGRADVAALPDGGFAVSWHDSRPAGGDTTGLGVHVQRFDPSGAAVGGDVLVNTTTAGNQADPSITALAGGGYVLTWTDRGAGWVIKAQLFDAAGARLGGEFVVNAASGGSAVESSVTTLANGNFAVAWYESDGAGPAHRIQLFTAAGIAVGAQIVTAAHHGGLQVGPVLAALADGGFALAWPANSAPLSDGSGRGIFVQAYDAEGAPSGPPMLVNSQAQGDQIDPSIVGLANGDFVVSWTDLHGEGADDDQVMAQLFSRQAATAITSAGAASAAENETLAAVVTATAGNGGPLTYSIAGGADAALFAIDAASGALSFLAAPDFEAPGDAGGDNVYEVVVAASDGTTAASQALFVTVTNRNEGIAFVSAGGGDEAALALDENQGDVVALLAADPDGTAPLYGIAGGADAALFALDPVTHMLRFIDLPDFEAPGDADGDNVYEVIVGVTDGELFDYQTIRVTVGNVHEQPEFATPARSFAVGENGTVVGAVTATGEGALTYAIAGGADSGRFTIDALTGALSFLAAPDFELPDDWDGDNIYDLIVSASDGAASATQAVSVAVGNIDEAVVLESFGGDANVSLSQAENGAGVGAVRAVDPDGETVSYAITGGADAARFAVDAATGALYFLAAPDFEAPGDADGDNVYRVVVTAAAGASSAAQAFAVAIVNVNEALAITSNGGGAGAALSLGENNRAVTVVTAADPDGGTPSYAIAGGADASRFMINAGTGLLQFVTAPNYEAPTDQNQDNVYVVIVRASDGQYSDFQTLTITVNNLRDGNHVTGTQGSDQIAGSSANPALRTSNEEDTVMGRDGNDNIQGLAGDDYLYGDGGNDVLIGGAGADRLTGGSGADQFTYGLASESNAAARDSIVDFSRAQGDRIGLAAIDADAQASGNQAFIFIGSAAFSNVAGQLRFETAGGVTIVSGDVNGDGVADLQIQLSAPIALLGSDFFL